MGRFLVALAIMLGFTVLSAPLAHAAPGSRWEVVPCATGSKAFSSPCVLGAKGAVGEAIGTCVAA